MYICLFHLSVSPQLVPLIPFQYLKSNQEPFLDENWTKIRRLSKYQTVLINWEKSNMIDLETLFFFSEKHVLVDGKVPLLWGLFILLFIQMWIIPLFRTCVREICAYSFIRFRYFWLKKIHHPFITHLPLICCWIERVNHNINSCVREIW